MDATRLTATNKPLRTYAGLVGQSGARILTLNGRAEHVGQRTKQPSGAFVTINSDGSWIYEPPSAIADLGSDQQAVDCFQCEVSTDGTVSVETISIVLRNPNSNAQPMIESQRTDNPLEKSSTTPVRILAKGTTHAETIIDLRIVSGHGPNDTPAVLILEQATGGTATVVEETGCLSFRPNGGFTGMAEVRCLLEKQNRSATFVVVHIHVQPPVQIHSSAQR